MGVVKIFILALYMGMYMAPQPLVCSYDYAIFHHTLYTIMKVSCECFQCGSLTIMQWLCRENENRVKTISLSMETYKHYLPQQSQNLGESHPVPAYVLPPYENLERQNQRFRCAYP